MFWETKDPPSPNIEILLESPDTKVELFLEEDNIIQECKTFKKNIVNYFTRPDVIRRMIELITTEPPEEVPMNERYRHANVACEILTMGLPSLDEKLLAETDTLNMLYSYLENEPPLNPLLASFFSKTFSMLFTKKSDQDWFLYQQTCLTLLEYLKTRGNFLDLICKHFTTPIVPDLIMEIMQSVESEVKKNLFEWLNEERLVEKLIDIIGDREQSEKHANVADFLCDLIHQGRTMRQDTESFEPVFGGSDPILQKIESATTLLALFNVILQPNTVESAIISGITVVLKIIKPAKVPDERNIERMLCFQAREEEIHKEFLTTVIRVIEPQIKYFNELLKTPPKKSEIITSAANLSPPFGMARLQIVRLFTELLNTKNDEILKAICGTDFLDILLALFKEYCWNNFLHSEVEKCLHSIFPYSDKRPKTEVHTDEAQACNVTKECQDLNSPSEDRPLLINEVNFDVNGGSTEEPKAPASCPSDIQIHAIVNCQIVSKLIECWRMNKELESAEKGRRLGFMGHLINILKHITKCISESEHIDALIENNLRDDNERNLWKSIVDEKDGELTKALSTQSKLLANHKPCEYNVSLDFFNDNNISDAFNGLCTLMDSSDADVIFTLDYNTQHDDNDFDDDDGDDDFNNINNVNNEGQDNEQRNDDDVKNALNLFQFGRSNDDDEGDDYGGDGGLSFRVEPNPFTERSWDNYTDDDEVYGAILDDIFRPSDIVGPKDKYLTAYDDLVAMLQKDPSVKTSANASTQKTNILPAGSEEYDNNANVEKSTSWSGDFASFEIPKKDTKFTSNFVDDYEDDEGMWTKPLGASTSALTVGQLAGAKPFDPFGDTNEFETNFFKTGSSLLAKADVARVPEVSAPTQLNNLNEDNAVVDQPTKDITTSSESKDEFIREINNEETTSKHKSNTLAANEAEAMPENTTTNTPTNQLTNTATAAEEISDVSTTT